MQLLRYDLKCYCSLGIILFMCSLAYKLLEIDVLRLGKEDTITQKDENVVSSDNKKFQQSRHVTKPKRYNSLSDLKKAANYALQNCLCSSKQRSSWFDQVVICQMWMECIFTISGKDCPQLSPYGCVMERKSSYNPWGCLH